MTGIVQIVGCGPGGAAWVLPRAREVVAGCDVVFGADDLQALFPEHRAARVDLPSRPETAAPLVEAAVGRGLNCAVLVRGDCGVRSLARGIERLLPVGICRRVPGLSSVQAACAAFGVDWDQAKIVSAHGRDLGELDRSTLDAPVLVLLGGGPGFGEVVRRAAASFGRCSIKLASDLTLPTERLSEPASGELVPPDLPSRTIAIFRKDSP